MPAHHARGPLMLRIQGSHRGDGLTRRDALRAGGVLGLSLAGLSRLHEMQAAPSAKQHANFGKAKACILLYLYGSPSQLETFDLKPEAPADVRSQFKTIDTSVPGV